MMRLLNLQRDLSRLGLLIIDELGFVPLSPGRHGDQPGFRLPAVCPATQAQRVRGSTLTAGLFYGYVVASPAKTGVNFRPDLRPDRAHRAGTTAARRDCRSRCIAAGRFRQPGAGHDLTDQPARLDRGP